MARKNHHVTTLSPEVTEAAPPAPVQEAALYESEAYGTPQPDEGATTTVMKPVGIGGPVPIVAPKHNTIQLQPIIVPLAVVPYMTQDTDVLRTDAPQDAAYEKNATAAEFTAAEHARARKRTAVRKRVFSFVTFVFAALAVAAYIVAYFHPQIHPEYSLAQVDIISLIKKWVETGTPFDYSLTLVNCLAALMLAVSFVASLVGFVAGRFARKTIALSALVALAAYAAELIHQVIAHHFDAEVDWVVLLMLALCGLVFVLAVAFAVAEIKREDREEEELLRSSSEI